MNAKTMKRIRRDAMASTTGRPYQKEFKHIFVLILA